MANKVRRCSELTTNMNNILAILSTLLGVVYQHYMCFTSLQTKLFDKTSKREALAYPQKTEILIPFPVKVLMTVITTSSYTNNDDDDKDVCKSFHCPKHLLHNITMFFQLFS